MHKALPRRTIATKYLFGCFLFFRECPAPAPLALGHHSHVGFRTVRLRRCLFPNFLNAHLSQRHLQSNPSSRGLPVLLRDLKCNLRPWHSSVARPPSFLSFFCLSFVVCSLSSTVTNHKQERERGQFVSTVSIYPTRRRTCKPQCYSSLMHTSEFEQRIPESHWLLQFYLFVFVGSPSVSRSMSISISKSSVNQRKPSSPHFLARWIPPPPHPPSPAWSSSLLPVTKGKEKEKEKEERKGRRRRRRRREEEKKILIS